MIGGEVGTAVLRSVPQERLNPNLERRRKRKGKRSGYRGRARAGASAHPSQGKHEARRGRALRHGEEEHCAAIIEPTSSAALPPLPMLCGSQSSKEGGCERFFKKRGSSTEASEEP